MNPSRQHHHPSRAVLAGIVLLLAGCASVPHADPRDPFESLNRGVSRFNDGFDKSLLKPVAASYKHHVPVPVRQGVSNFFGNLGDAWSAVNSALQLKAPEAAQSVLRVAVNTVFGIGGLLDIAGEAGIERHKQDFGSTLARWGVPAGPYLVLPLLGPSTMRDTAGLPLDWLGNPVRFVNSVAPRNSMYSLDAVDTRTLLLPLSAVVDDTALDRYTFVRDAYLQHREAQLTADSDGHLEITD
jgi:phospholipid-binding lipoprotein MlaA